MKLLRYRHIREALASLMILLALSMLSCRGSSPVPLSPQDRQISIGVAISRDLDQNRISVTIQADNAADLFQMSGRLVFDAEAVQPLTSVRGSLVDNRAAFFSLVNRQDYIPFAFTYHEGEHQIHESGSIVKIEFQVLDPDVETGIRLFTDQDYLIARNAAGASIELKLVAGQ